MQEKRYYVYIMASNSHAVLYTGVTSDLPKRAYEHREHVVPGFTARYNVRKLVYYEVYDDPEHAIAREKQIKAGSRRKKVELIRKMNPKWEDLFALVCVAEIASSLRSSQ